jgi:hypothetical protein
MLDDGDASYYTQARRLARRGPAQGGDLADDGFAFGVAGVEVGGDADADARAVVDEEAALFGIAGLPSSL